MKFILGKKIEMTQRFADDGRVIPVTAVQAGPCVVTQVKSNDTDGYIAVQMGYGEHAKPNKPQAGHSKGLRFTPRQYREFRVDDAGALQRGDVITVSTFAAGDAVAVSGTSKGKGFQGVVRRHGFKGGKGSHGDKDQLRMPGSIGATDPARVFKGTRMGGQMGSARVTTTGLEIVDIDTENDILYIKGSLPGARQSLLLISGEGEMQVVPETADTKEADAQQPPQSDDNQPGQKATDPAAQKDEQTPPTDQAAATTASDKQPTEEKK